jgi:hypothetical protein
MVFQSVITQGQTNQSTYTHEKARLELSEIQQRLKNGASVRIKTELLDYIYENRGHFPEITNKMTIEEKLTELITIQSQLTQILYSLLASPMDSVSYEHALVTISLGYVSAQLMPLVNKFMKTFDKSDETYEIRINGMRQAFYGMKGMLVGYLLTTFVENKNPEFTPMLIDNVNYFGPKISKELPKDIRRETIMSIKNTVEPRVKKNLKKQYNELIKKL